MKTKPSRWSGDNGLREISAGRHGGLVQVYRNYRVDKPPTWTVRGLTGYVGMLQPCSHEQAQDAALEMLERKLAMALAEVRAARLGKVADLSRFNGKKVR